MPIQSVEDKKFLEAATGYAELGMLLEANDELEKIDPFLRSLPEVLKLRLKIYIGVGKFELAAVVARKLWDSETKSEWAISWSDSVRQYKSLEPARRILLNAERKLPHDAAIKFHLAKLESAFGRIDHAKVYLMQAFQREPKWKLRALDDKDFKALWNSFGN
jgi:tetratricopeptide (TPR) repeat protein